MLTSDAEVAAIRPGWSELTDLAGGGPFTSAWWAETWWRHLGKGRLAVAVAEDDDGLVAVAPLHERRLVGLRVARFLGHGLGAISGLLVDPARPEGAEAVWRLLLGGPARFLDLVEYAEPDAGLEALLRSGATVRVVEHDTCPVIGLTGTFEAYAAGRSKNLRRTLRTARHQAEEGGRSFTVECVTDAAGLARVLPEMARVQGLAEEANARQHFFRGPLGRFTHELLGLAADDGALRVFVGRLDDRVVSYDVAFAGTDRLSLWIGRFDPAFATVAPGHLALASIIEHSFGAGLNEVDLLLGDHAYKRRWSTGEYATLHVTASARPSVHHVGCGLLAARTSGRAVVSRLTGPR